MRSFLHLFCVVVFACCGFSAQADFVDSDLHTGVSIASAMTIDESEAVRFGNLTVTALGTGDATIILSPDGDRTVNNGSDQIVLLTGGGIGGSQGAGRYQIDGAGAGTNIYITFTDHAGAPITSGNPVELSGPSGSDTFDVDTFTFNQSGSDGGGDYITTDGGGTATVLVGATLHTVAGATSYDPGTYRGTFQIIASF